MEWIGKVGFLDPRQTGRIALLYQRRPDHRTFKEVFCAEEGKTDWSAT